MLETYKEQDSNCCQLLGKRKHSSLNHLLANVILHYTLSSHPLLYLGSRDQILSDPVNIISLGMLTCFQALPSYGWSKTENFGLGVCSCQDSHPYFLGFSPYHFHVI